LDQSERSNRLQNVYSARNNRELASRYDEWAEDYDDDMLSLGYAIPAVAAAACCDEDGLDGIMGR